MKQKVINFIKNVSKKAGVTLLKNHQYDELLNQRDTLLSMYMEEVKPKKRTSTVCVLFSLDRPIQVLATLESYFKYMQNPVPVHVVYGMTDAKYEPAYHELIDMFKGKNVTFHKETKFRATLIDVLESLTEDNLLFMTDDDIFTRTYDMQDLLKFDPLVEIPTLRLAPYFTRCYTVGVDQKPPHHMKKSEKYPELLEWDWSHEECDNEWAYPMSVEMHLFDRREITAMTKSLSFKAPNTYEGMLMMYFSYVKNRKGLCSDKQYLFNNPCNKVQVENDNIAGDITPEFLLKQWNNGLKIDIEPFHHLRTTGPHEEKPFSFIKR